VAKQWGKGILRLGVVVEFDDPELGAVSVAAILGDPDRYDGETLADPIEGVGYGRNCGIVQCHADGVHIFSFAHDGTRDIMANSVTATRHQGRCQGGAS
jgi:hypothetical protein